MGITTYQRCQKIMEEAKIKGYEHQIGWDDLALIIRKIAGSRKETLRTYRKELQLCGFLTSDNQLVFNIIKGGDKIV